MCLLSEIESGACLSDDMGLGKTLQTICFLAWLYQQDAKRKFIICCPASLIYNWKAEIEKFAHTSMLKYLREGRLSSIVFLLPEIRC
jgi:SNF2 family DNA or RNA helicase